MSETSSQIMVSNATTFDLHSQTFVTKEAELLPGIIPNLTDVDAPIAEIIGNTNCAAPWHNPYFTDMEYGTDPKGHLEYCEELTKWQNRILGREIATRTIEQSILTGAKIPSSAIRKTLSLLNTRTNLDRSRILGSPFNIRRVGQLAQSALMNDNTSLGDSLAALRISLEFNMQVAAGSVSESLEDSAKAMAKKIRSSIPISKQQMTYTKRAIKSPIQSTSSLDWFILARAARLKTLPERLLTKEDGENLTAALIVFNGLTECRSQVQQYKLISKNGNYIYKPANTSFYPTSKEVGERESVTVTKPDTKTEAEIAAAEERRRAEAERQRDEQAAEESAQREAIAEHDQPILDELNTLATGHNEIIGEFTDRSSKNLRASGLVGGHNSLSRKMLESFDKLTTNEINRLVRVYAELHTIARANGEASTNELTTRLQRLENLRSQYEQYAISHQLRGATRPTQLDKSIKGELNWLGENFETFEATLLESDHKKFYNDKISQTLMSMLGVKADETEWTEASDNRKETTPEAENYASPLKLANELAEQLNWVILPDEHITVEEIICIAKSALNKAGKDAVVEEYRMAALLELREGLGGTLYRSDERTLGDSDNLYFALRFQDSVTGEWYAVAENPVYGNATYVLRENCLPLQPGETVLTALKLHRRDVRELGAKQIIHSEPQLDTHLDRVFNAIDSLARKAAVKNSN